MRQVTWMLLLGAGLAAAAGSAPAAACDGEAEAAIGVALEVALPAVGCGTRRGLTVEHRIGSVCVTSGDGGGRVEVEALLRCSGGMFPPIEVDASVAATVDAACEVTGAEVDVPVKGEIGDRFAAAWEPGGFLRAALQEQLSQQCAAR